MVVLVLMVLMVVMVMMMVMMVVVMMVMMVMMVLVNVYFLGRERPCRLATASCSPSPRPDYNS